MGSEQKRLTVLTLVMKYFIYLLSILSDLFLRNWHGVVTGSEVRMGPSGRRLDESFSLVWGCGTQTPAFCTGRLKEDGIFPWENFLPSSRLRSGCSRHYTGGRQVVGAGPQEALFMHLAQLCSLETEWTRVTSKRSQFLPHHRQEALNFGVHEATDGGY